MSKPKTKKPTNQDSGDKSKKKKSKVDDMAPPVITRQKSNDYPDWYHTVPDEDVWGVDENDPWDDGKATKGKKTDDLDGFELPADSSGWDENEKEEKDDEEEEEGSTSKGPFRIFESKIILKKRTKLIEDNADVMGLQTDEVDLILRYVRYDRKKIDQFLSDKKFQDDVRLQSGISTKKAKPLTAKTVQCSLWCSVVPIDEAHSLACGHYTCNDCWQGFLESEINAGINSVFSKCPAQDEKGNKCHYPVDYKTMKKYLKKQHADKLDQWILDQYIDSSKSLKWCPQAGCGLAANTTVVTHAILFASVARVGVFIVVMQHIVLLHVIWLKNG